MSNKKNYDYEKELNLVFSGRYKAGLLCISLVSCDKDDTLAHL